MSTATARSEQERFIADTLAWLRARLLRDGVDVDADTPLFEDGLIDSLRILRLIAWTEHAVGRTIPDVQIRMDNFRTVRRIAEVFLAATLVPAGGAADVDG